MKIIATKDAIKIVEMQHQPTVRPNPLAEVVTDLLETTKHHFTKDGAVIEFTNAKKGQNHEQY